MSKYLRVLTLVAACGAIQATATAATVETEEQKTVYAIGVMLSQTLAGFNLTDAEVALVAAGLTDAALGREVKVDAQAYRAQIQALGQERAAALAQVEQDAAGPFLDKLAGESGAQRTDSGLIYIETQAGDGASPAATDTVQVHYHGTLRDGTVFDSSVERGEPATFPLNRVIPCWTEGLQMMKVGGKAKIGCPADIAYGDRGSPPRIQPGAPLVFEVELIGIE